MSNDFLLFLAIIWFVLSVIVGSIGEKRRIGFLHSALASLFFSPTIAIILVFLSPTKADIERKDEEMDLLRRIAEK